MLLFVDIVHILGKSGQKYVHYLKKYNCSTATVSFPISSICACAVQYLLLAFDVDPSPYKMILPPSWIYLVSPHQHMPLHHSALRVSSLDTVL